MADFQIVLSDPKTGKSYKIDATGAAAGSLIGKRVGEEVDGNVFGLPGYSITITGGTDRTGIPARRDLPGGMRRRLLISQGIGFNERYGGERRRKSVRGNEITADFVQINAKVAKYGKKSLRALLEGEEEPEAEEAAVVEETTPVAEPVIEPGIEAEEAAGAGEEPESEEELQK